MKHWYSHQSIFRLRRGLGMGKSLDTHEHTYTFEYGLLNVYIYTPYEIALKWIWIDHKTGSNRIWNSLRNVGLK